MKVEAWKELYPSIGLRPDHGFEFVRLKYAATQENYLALLRTIGVDEGDVLKEQREFSGNPTVVWMAEVVKTSADKVYPLLRYYLSENATNTFAIAQQNAFMDGSFSGAFFYIGFRNPKDVFVFLLKFPNAIRIKLVRRDLGFYVRVAANDDITFSGVDYFDERNKIIWNKEDPQGFL